MKIYIYTFTGFMALLLVAAFISDTFNVTELTSIIILGLLSALCFLIDAKTQLVTQEYEYKKNEREAKENNVAENYKKQIQDLEEKTKELNKKIAFVDFLKVQQDSQINIDEFGKMVEQYSKLK